MCYVVLYYDQKHRFGIFDKDTKKNRILQNLAYIAIGAIEGIGTGLLLKYMLKFDVSSLPIYLGECMLVGIAFMSIIQFLIRHLGDIGKFIALIILVLQLAASGGTFPVETISEGFKGFTNILPMTYSIRVFRDILIPVDNSLLYRNTCILLGIVIGVNIINMIIELIKIRINKNIKEKDEEKNGKIEDKIEKTMDYKIVGGNDELLNSKIAENYRGYIGYNPFINTRDNPDTILEITTKLIEYTPNKVKETKYMNDFDEIYTDENGKKATNTVKYLGKHFFKTSNMKVEVKYKLTSTLTGEVILQGSKTLDYEEYTYWDTYTVISGTLKDRSQFYQDGREETLSDKERFFREMAIKVLRAINQELKKLPDYDFLKIYIS